MSKSKLAFIGAGNMASALISGLVTQGFDPKAIWASDPDQEQLNKIAAVTRVNTTTNNLQAVADATVIILAVKPQQLKSVVIDLTQSPIAKQTLIISIVAGITMASLQQWLGDDLAIVRCMPNIPATIGLGATGLFANQYVNDTQKRFTDDVAGAVGISVWLEDEAQLNAVTAVSGSGPAYFFLFIEAIQKAGIALGLDQHISNQLALQTALGAAKMAVDSNTNVAELRRKVTSPAGTTEKALDVFEQGKLLELVKQALTAAKMRAQELADEHNC